MSVPFVFNLAGQAILDSNNRVEDWLPKSFQSTADLAWFRKNFASEQFIIVSWDGCRLGSTPADDDPRIAMLAERLVGSRETLSDTSPGAPSELDRACQRYFSSVLTGRMVLEQLTAPPLNLEREQAIERIRGSLVGEDGQHTCLLITLTPEAPAELNLVLGRGQRRLLRPDVPSGVLWQLLTEVGVDSSAVHLGGPPVDNVAIDEEGKRTLIRLAGLSGLIGTVLAWWSLRSVALTLLVFFCGVLSAAASLAMVRLTGGAVDAILMSMPSLVYVLSISGAVHLISYYRESVSTHGMFRASERAIALAWKPAVLCSVTTAVGLLSLLSSELIPIRRFGIYSATGVMSLVAILYFFLPAALQVTQVGRRWLVSNDSSRATRAPSGKRVFMTIGTAIVSHHRSVLVLCVMSTVFAAYGLRYSSTSINLLKLFDSKARVIGDYQWLESNVGNLVPMELVVRFPKNQMDTVGDLSLLQRFDFVMRLQQILRKDMGESGTDVIGTCMSASTFLPNVPFARGNASFLHRKVLESRLEDSAEQLESTGFYRRASTEGDELWRISLRVAAFEDVDYGVFVDHLRLAAAPLLRAYELREEVLNRLQSALTEANERPRVLIVRSVEAKQDLTIAPSALAITDRQLHTDGQSRGELWAYYLGGLLREYGCSIEYWDSALATTPLDRLEQLKTFDAVVLSSDTPLNDVRLAETFGSKLVWTEPDRPGQGAEQVVDIVYTGVVPIVYQAQRALLNSLVSSTWWSFLTITPIMMLVTRSFLAGLVAMLPNLMPILLVFGGMGWLNVPIDIGSMMTASIALGVAVDDTIHFLARYRETLDNVVDRRLAIIETYAQCAVPTLQAAMISGLGLSVFAFSSFTPTQRFGWLMLCILFAGVASELILLPAILISRLGKIFRSPVSNRRDYPEEPNRSDRLPVRRPHFMRPQSVRLK